MGNLVCDGTEFSCPFCTSKLKLKVPSSPAKSQGKNLANTGNCFFPPPGGQCTVVPSAPVPCTPAATPIDPGQKPVKIAELPALGVGCKFQCAKGGLLTVSSDGQTKAKHEEAQGAAVGKSAASAALLGIGSTESGKSSKQDSKTEGKENHNNNVRDSEKKQAGKLPPPKTDSKRNGHIFRPAPGHFNPSTTSSQKRCYSIMQNTASNKANEVPKNLLSNHKQSAGIRVFRQKYNNGEVWVETRGGKIMNGGVNAKK